MYASYSSYVVVYSKFTDIPDSFMDMISSHGGLEHMILSVGGIYTLIDNSPNLMSFCAFINQQLCNDHGRKVQSKDFKAKVKLHNSSGIKLHNSSGI